MNPSLKTVLQKPVNHTMAFNTGTTLKGRRDDFKPEMGFAPLPVTGMPDMPVTFVDKPDLQRIKGF